MLSSVMDLWGITWEPPGHSNTPSNDSLAWVKEWLQVDFPLVVLVSVILHQMAWILWSGALGVFLFWIPSTLWIVLRGKGTGNK